MGKIVVSENLSLDGVVQDPTGDEGFRFGGWFHQIADSDREAWASVELEEALGAEALLMGRRSYEWFAARWASRSGEWADRLRNLPKYVVTSTLTDPLWNNSTFVSADEVSTLKQGVDGDMVVYASAQLVHALLEYDLVDELRLMIFPFILGAGQRVFGGPGDPKPMRLVDSRTVGDGLALLTYQRVRNA
jgi:dihydrofolate reductase